MWKVLRAKFLGSDGVFYSFSICKFGSFNNLFATSSRLSELCFIFKRFILLVQMEKVTSMNYGSSTSNWKPWKQATENLHLIQYSWWGTCTSISTWIHSQNSLAAAAELLSLNLSFHRISLKWSQRPSQSMQIVISPKIVPNRVSAFDCNRMSMKTEITTWLEQMLAPEEKNKPKRGGVWECQSGTWVGKLNIWVRSFEIETF